MTMKSFRVEPRVEHVEIIKRTCGYLCKYNCGTIRFRIEEPDASAMPNAHYDWEESVYGKVEEVLPINAPEQLGKQVVAIRNYDANLYHNVITGRSPTSVLRFLGTAL